MATMALCEAERRERMWIGFAQQVGVMGEDGLIGLPIT